MEGRNKTSSPPPHQAIQGGCPTPATLRDRKIATRDQPVEIFLIVLAVTPFHWLHQLVRSSATGQPKTSGGGGGGGGGVGVGGGGVGGDENFDRALSLRARTLPRGPRHAKARREKPASLARGPGPCFFLSSPGLPSSSGCSYYFRPPPTTLPPLSFLSTISVLRPRPSGASEPGFSLPRPGWSRINAFFVYVLRLQHKALLVSFYPPPVTSRLSSSGPDPMSKLRPVLVCLFFFFFFQFFFFFVFCSTLLAFWPPRPSQLPLFPRPLSRPTPRLSFLPPSAIPNFRVDPSAGGALSAMLRPIGPLSLS